MGPMEHKVLLTIYGYYTMLVVLTVAPTQKSFLTR